MIKLRGVNLFPEAIGEIVAKDPSLNGEYVCIVDRDEAGREEMTVMVEVSDESARATIEDDLSGRLKETFGVKLAVKATKQGELDRFTGLSATSKIKRLIDRRSTAPGAGS